MSGTTQFLSPVSDRQPVLCPSLFVAENHYKCKEALTWGICGAHFAIVKDEGRPLMQRVTHFILCALEIIPGLSQVISLIECAIANILYKREHKSIESKQKTALANLLPSIEHIAKASTTTKPCTDAEFTTALANLEKLFELGVANDFDKALDFILKLHADRVKNAQIHGTPLSRDTLSLYETLCKHPLMQKKEKLQQELELLLKQNPKFLDNPAEDSPMAKKWIEISESKIFSIYSFVLFAKELKSQAEWMENISDGAIYWEGDTANFLIKRNPNGSWFRNTCKTKIIDCIDYFDSKNCDGFVLQHQIKNYDVEETVDGEYNRYQYTETKNDENQYTQKS